MDILHHQHNQVVLVEVELIMDHPLQVQPLHLVREILVDQVVLNKEVPVEVEEQILQELQELPEEVEGLVDPDLLHQLQDPQ
jgi:hypothetical protein